MTSLLFGFTKTLLKYLHRPKFSLNSCGQSRNSFEISLCTLSLSPFLIVFGFCGPVQQVSPKLFNRTSISFKYLIFGYLWKSNTESFEDDGEVGEGVEEEELVDKPGTTSGTQFEYIASNSLSISDEMWCF